MAKFDVLIVEKSSQNVVAKWNGVSARRAKRIVRKWRSLRVRGTSVCVSASRALLRRLH